MSRTFRAGALGLLLASTAVLAEDRLALVIGNSSYTRLPALPHAGADAQAVAAKLETLGFRLVGGSAQVDVSGGRFDELLAQLAEQARTGDTVFVYFQGHGVAWSGANYLVPALDGGVATLEDVPAQAINLATVLRPPGGARESGLTIAVIDASYAYSLPTADGSFTATGGLQPVRAARDMLVAYAAAPGERIAPSREASAMSQALLAYLDSPGLRIEDIFNGVGTEVARLTEGRQQPWRRSSLSDAFYLAPQAPPSDTELAASDRSTADIAYWNAIAAANDPESLRRYLETFPDGLFVALARKKLAEAQARSISVSAAAAARSYVAPGVTSRPRAGTSKMRLDTKVRQGPLVSVRGLRPGRVFRECEECPEMVVVPPGTFEPPGGREPVEFARPFAIARYEVTFDEWDACVGDGGCEGHDPDDGGLGRGRRPVVNLGWQHARAYAAWLQARTGAAYRLLTGAEWDYAGYAEPEESGHPFGLHGLLGGVREWVEGCAAPGCREHPVRGESPGEVAAKGSPSIGFRVARSD